MTEPLDPILADEGQVLGAAPGAAVGDAAEPEDLPSDGRSFAERFRGTAWGEPGAPAADAGDSPPEPPPARGRSRRLAGIGIALLGGSVLAVILLVLGGSNGTLGGPAPTDTLPRMTPGTPAPGAAAAAIDRFLAVIAEPKLAYEVRMRGSLELGGADIETRFSARVVGSDVDVRYVIQRSGLPTTEARVIAIGSRTWVQAGDVKAWRRARARPGDLPELDVFDGLADAAQLGYVGSEMRRGYRTDHLRTVRWWVSPLATRLLAGFPGATVRESRLDVWVLPDGRPLEVVTTLDATVPAALGQVVVAGRSSYVLARVGETAGIRAPR